LEGEDLFSLDTKLALGMKVREPYKTTGWKHRRIRIPEKTCY